MGLGGDIDIPVAFCSFPYSIWQGGEGCKEDREGARQVYDARVNPRVGAE